MKSKKHKKADHAATVSEKKEKSSSLTLETLANTVIELEKKVNEQISDLKTFVDGVAECMVKGTYASKKSKQLPMIQNSQINPKLMYSYIQAMDSADEGGWWECEEDDQCWKCPYDDGNDTQVKKCWKSYGMDKITEEKVKKVCADEGIKFVK